MTARTPLETLTLARDYLDSLLADSTSGNSWMVDSDDPTYILQPDQPGNAWDGRIIAQLQPDSFGLVEEAHGHLIVALHATAPAIRELFDLSTNWTMAQLVTYGIYPLAEALLSTSHAAQWTTDREATQ